METVSLVCSMNAASTIYYILNKSVDITLVSLADIAI